MQGGRVHNLNERSLARFHIKAYHRARTRASSLLRCAFVTHWKGVCRHHRSLEHDGTAHDGRAVVCFNIVFCVHNCVPPNAPPRHPKCEAASLFLSL